MKSCDAVRRQKNDKMLLHADLLRSSNRRVYDLLDYDLLSVHAVVCTRV